MTVKTGGGPRTIYDDIYGRIEKVANEILTLKKRALVPTHPVYDSTNWPDQAVHGQIVRDIQSPCVLWVYAEDDAWHKIGVGTWHYVGDPGEPDFQNGWGNVGYPNVYMRFRILLGCGDNIALELEGDVTGGTTGTTVFTLPLGFRPDLDIPLSAHDNAGKYVPCRVFANGNFVRGVP